VEEDSTTECFNPKASSTNWVLVYVFELTLSLEAKPQCSGKTLRPIIANQSSLG